MPLSLAYVIFTLVGTVSSLATLYTLYQGRKFDHAVDASMSRKKHGYRPTVCLIMPCKGAEPNLDRNIRAALGQDYGTFRLVVVTDREDDPAYAIGKSITPAQNLTLMASETSPAHSGPTGKIAALLAAIDSTWGQAEVYAFVDSDAYVQPNWLSELVDPLGDDSVGSTTGFRWYFPVEGFWSYVESAWNAAGTNLLFHEKYNFPWGGAMAVRRETLEKIEFRKIWATAISDDLALNSGMKKKGLRILCLPQCTVATFNKNDFRGLLAWTLRQTTLTRVYHNSLWKYAFAAYAFFDFAFILGLASLVLGLLVESTWYVPAILMLSPIPVGIVRAFQRAAAFKRALPEMAEEFDRTMLQTALASLTVPWVMLYTILKSTRTRKVDWRGRTYILGGA